jgi:hypothetical protein
MRTALFSQVLLLGLGAITLMSARPAMAESFQTVVASAPTAIAQEPNQDNLQMTCPGSIGVNDVDFTVFFTREAGFSRIEFRRRSNSQLIAEATLSYDRENAEGQAIWRGSVNNAASVTLVQLSTGAAQPGDQVSVAYDGQWGRGTCRRSN